MTTVTEFYERWENIEEGLINMTASPMLSTSSLAEEELKELYQIKKRVDGLKQKPNKEIERIQTNCFGFVKFETIEKFVNNYQEISSEKYLLIKCGAVFSPQYTKENLQWFIDKVYLPNNKEVKKT